jgi:hypothetical protein
VAERDTRDLTNEASMRIREFAFNAKVMQNKSKQTAELFERRKS